MSQNDTASVEDILESIKKVIARDNREGAEQVRRQREVHGLKQIAEEISEDIDEDDEDDGFTQGADEEEILDLDVEDAVSSAPSPEPEVEAVEAEIPTISASVEETLVTSRAVKDALVSDEVRSSMQENFAALAMVSKPGAQPKVVRSGETSLEGLVTDLLRPMLAEWLDENLPSMVEAMVKEEISRISGKRS